MRYLTYNKRAGQGNSQNNFIKGNQGHIQEKKSPGVLAFIQLQFRLNGNFKNGNLAQILLLTEFSSEDEKVAILPLLGRDRIKSSFGYAGT